ncbi:hypothetical protein H5410_005168 [Solanum commersonii]|uniref:Uncharacterized protein n=1 Tax=Solanum commersonii TaxID=4109 RepID=A0A9J6A5N8_SOLCO|nr:hypothetical protein H5410_005168 [Solanum commersonii]
MYSSLQTQNLARCQPIIGFDGCHLKGNQKGSLLITIGIDRNNTIYPVKFALVERFQAPLLRVRHQYSQVNQLNQSRIPQEEIGEHSIESTR